LTGPGRRNRRIHEGVGPLEELHDVVFEDSFGNVHEIGHDVPDYVEEVEEHQHPMIQWQMSLIVVVAWHPRQQVHCRVPAPVAPVGSYAL
jgi:hypothetical protein